MISQLAGIRRGQLVDDVAGVIINPLKSHGTKPQLVNVKQKVFPDFSPLMLGKASWDFDAIVTVTIEDFCPKSAYIARLEKSLVLML